MDFLSELIVELRGLFFFDVYILIVVLFFSGVMIARPLHDVSPVFDVVSDRHLLHPSAGVSH